MTNSLHKSASLSRLLARVKINQYDDHITAIQLSSKLKHENIQPILDFSIERLTHKTKDFNFHFQEKFWSAALKEADRDIYREFGSCNLQISCAALSVYKHSIIGAALGKCIVLLCPRINETLYFESIRYEYLYNGLIGSSQNSSHFLGTGNACPVKFTNKSNGMRVSICSPAITSWLRTYRIALAMTKDDPQIAIEQISQQTEAECRTEGKEASDFAACIIYRE